MGMRGEWSKCPNALGLALAVGLGLVGWSANGWGQESQFLHEKNLVIDEKGFHHYPIDAEAFTSSDKGWTEEWQGYFTSSPNHTSRNLLVADGSARPAKAVKKLKIGKAGDYVFYVRYMKPFGFGTVFGVRLEQKRKVVLDRQYGYKSDVVLNPWRGRRATGEWFWHNSDPVFTLGDRVPLAEGPLTVTLFKAENEGPPARREIDLVFLTNDLNLRPQGHVFGGAWKSASVLRKFRTPLWYKIVLEERPGNPAPFTVHDGKWMVNGYWMGPRGDRHALCKLDGKVVWKKPGKEGIPELDDPFESPWQRVDVSTMEVPCFVVHAGPGLKARFLIANAEPCGKHVIWSGWPEENGKFEVICPIGHGFYEHDSVLANGRPVTYPELLADQTERIRAHKVPGHRPRLFAACGYPTHTGLDLHQALGCNAAFCDRGEQIYEPETAKRLGTNVTFSYPNSCVRVPKEPEKQEQLREQRSREPLGHIARNYKMIEESYAPALRVLAESEEEQGAFRKLARTQGVDPLALLSPEALRGLVGKSVTGDDLWQKVKLGAGTVAESIASPQLYYHSIYFRGWSHSEAFRRQTEAVLKLFPQDRTNPGSCFWSDGYDVGLARRIDPFLCFRRGSFTSYCSENSWGRDAANYLGPQSMSYEACLARALTKYGDFPRGTMCTHLLVSGVNGYGVNEHYIPLQGLCGFAQGLDTFWYYFLARDCSSAIFHESSLKGIKTINYTIGGVEDDILGTNAKVVKAPVALGWSISTDIWDLTVRPRVQISDMYMQNNVYPQERHQMYVLLRHCQAPVDILDERDIEEGRLEGYKVYVMVGDHFSRKAATKLIEWVEAGGTVISAAGGGIWDEYHRENPAMLKLFGVQSARLQKHDVALRPKLELVHRSPLDTAFFPEGEIDYYGYVQEIVLAKEGSVEVLARTCRSRPAAVSNTVGQGRAILCGFLPSMAYVKPAIPKWPFGRGGRPEHELSSFIPTRYSPVVRSVFKRLLAESGVEMPVECSEPLVEPTLWKGEDNKVRVCLVNVSLKPIKDLRITTHGLDYGRVVDVATGQQVAGGEKVFRTAIDQLKVLRFE